MTNFNYALDKYSWESALLWGNFIEHCEKARDSKATLGDRCVHILIAAAEFLPIIGQIASIFEKIIVENFSIPSSNINSSDSKINIEKQPEENNVTPNQITLETLTPATQTVLADKKITNITPEVNTTLDTHSPESQPEPLENGELPNPSIHFTSSQPQNIPLDSNKSEPEKNENDNLNNEAKAQEKKEQDEKEKKELETKNATVIQRFCRKYFAEQEMKKATSAVTTIQKYCRMHTAQQKKEEIQIEKAATTMQRYFRMHSALQEKEQIQAERAATTMQRYFRMHSALQEKEHIQTEKAATTIQKYCRMQLATQKKEQNIAATESVTKIQSFCRVHLASKKKGQIQEEIRASTTMQRYCRMHSALQKKEKIIKATTEIQRFYRMHLARRKAEALRLPSLQIDPQSSLHIKLNEERFGDFFPYMTLSSFIEKSNKYFVQMTRHIPKESMDLLNKRIEELDQKIQLKRRLNSLDEHSRNSILLEDILPSWEEAYILKFSLLTDGEIRNLRVSDVEKVDSKFISKEIGIKLRKWAGNENGNIPIADAQLSPESIKNLKLIDFSRLTSEQIKEHVNDIHPIAYYVISILKLPSNVLENLSSEQLEIFSDELRSFDKKQTLSFLQTLLNTQCINKTLLNKLLPEFSSSLDVLSNLNEEKIFKLYPFLSSHHWRSLSKPQSLALLRQLLKMDKIDTEILKNLMPDNVFNSKISWDDLTDEEIIKIYPLCLGFHKYNFEQKSFEILCNLYKSDYSEADLDQESGKLIWIYHQKERLYSRLAENYFKLGCLDKAVEAIKQVSSSFWEKNSIKEAFFEKVVLAHLNNHNKEKACSLIDKIIDSKVQEKLFAHVADSYCSENDLDGLKNLYKYGSKVKDICILKAAQTHFKNGLREKACEIVDTMSYTYSNIEPKKKFFLEVADSYCDEGKLDELQKLHKYGREVKDICTLSIANSNLKKGDRKQAYTTIQGVSSNEIKQDFLLQLANSHYDHDELDAALKIIKPLGYFAAKEPFIIKIANAYLKKGKRKTAYAVINTISNNKAKDKFLKQLAESYYTAGKLEKAYQTIQKGYLSSETRKTFALKIAKAYFERGEKEKAVEILDESILRTQETFMFLIQIAQKYFSENNEPMVLKIIEKIAHDALLTQLASILETRIYFEMMWGFCLKQHFFVLLAQNCLAQTTEYFSNNNLEAILQEILRKATDDTTIKDFLNYNSSPSSQSNDDKFDPYEILGLTATASKEEVRKAFKDLSLKYHPDKAKQSGEADEENVDLEKRRGANEEKFKSIRRAYDMIMDLLSQKSSDPTHQSNPSNHPILRSSVNLLGVGH